MTYEQEVIRSVFDAYIGDIKAVSDKDRPTVNMLEEVKNRAIKALEQQPSEDCVSRAEMLKYQQYLRGKMSNEENHKLWEFIKDLPPVTPTQRWIPLVWDEYPTVNSDGSDDYVYAVDYSVPMPEEDEWVLITDENHNVRTVQYDGYDFGDYVREEILAWKHSPNPYIE